jgi:predicted nuclease with TOPRIM domain
MIKEETAGMTLDEMEAKLEQATRDKKAFKKAMLKPQMEVDKYRKAIKTLDDQIDQLQELQRMAMGDQEQVDTEFFHFKMGTVNPSTSRNWNLERDKDATPKELTAVFERFDDTLIKTSRSVNETEIKNRLASGELYVTPDGRSWIQTLRLCRDTPGHSRSPKFP